MLRKPKGSDGRTDIGNAGHIKMLEFQQKGLKQGPSISICPLKDCLIAFPHWSKKKLYCPTPKKSFRSIKNV